MHACLCEFLYMHLYLRAGAFVLLILRCNTYYSLLSGHGSHSFDVERGDPVCRTVNIAGHYHRPLAPTKRTFVSRRIVQPLVTLPGTGGGYCRVLPDF